jgi:Tol biopolymer transport system component
MAQFVSWLHPVARGSVWIALLAICFVLPQPGVSASAAVRGTVVVGAAGVALYMLDADGKNVRLLLRERNANESQPALSPDGRQIAFVRESTRGTGLYLIDRGGQHLRQAHSLSDPFAYPSWSPDGRQIAYSDLLGGIRILSLRSRTIRVVGSDGDAAPSWSPDGKRLVYEHQVEGGGTSIWVMNTDGSQRRQLTHPPGHQHGLSIYDHNPEWSPDSRFVAFERGYDTWLYDFSTGRSRLVARNAQYPTWSPTSDRLLVARIGSGLNATGLYTIDLDFGNASLVVRNVWGESSWR